MKKKISFKLPDNIKLPFIKEKTELSINQLYNLSTYLHVLEKHSESIISCKTIYNSESINHAVNYNSDSNNMYWFVLDIEYNFYDISIPLKMEILSGDDLSITELEIVKILKEYFNNNC